jgi:hypothetical protein
MHKVYPALLTLFVISVFHVASVRSDELPPEGANLISEFEKQVKEIEDEAAAKIRQRKAELVKSLEKLRDSLTEARKFDEALVLHERLRELKIERVMVEWGGRWWPATVREKDDADYLIRYDGHDETWDEWVTKDRIRFESVKEPLPPGRIRR